MKRRKKSEKDLVDWEKRRIFANANEGQTKQFTSRI